jgi:glycosyltransferase involved in cell wall biosynthesis
VLEDEERLQKLGVNGREKVEDNFTLAINSQNYLDLYEDLYHIM